MKTKLKIIIFVIAMLIIICIGTRVEAASASITATKTTATVGETVTISVNINAAAWNLKVSGEGVSGGNIVGYDANGSNTSTTKTYSLNTSSVGTYKIKLTGDITDGSTDVNTKISEPITVTVKAKETSTSNTSGNSKGSSSSGGTTNKTTTTTKPVEEKVKSKNSALSALSITEGAITPEFNKDVKEYALTVSNEITIVNITATPEDSKATVAIEGNEELKEGENTVTVKVTAEDGSTTNYTIKVTRSRAKLSLQSLAIKYENQEGQVIDIPLNPEFKFDVTEYSLQDLEYWVNKLDIEAIANLEGATIDIQGADNLQTGENTITITLKIPQEGETPEGEEPQDEIIVYTIKVNKEKEPTLLGKISIWFKGIFGGVTTWYNNNQEKVILYALGVCIIALIGLSIYIVVDYNKYKDVITKVKKVKEINNIDKENNIIEEKSQNRNTETIEEISEEETKNNKGKHF